MAPLHPAESRADVTAAPADRTAGHDARGPGDSGTPLLGRDVELSTLSEAVDDLARGRGRLVWIEGEPGIGKSALLDVVALAAREHGCEALRAAADELSQLLPLRVVLDCLGVHTRSRDPRRAEIAAFLEAPTGSAFGSPDPMPAAVERLLTLVDQLCADAPLVLALDDLQWADEWSLLFVQRLSRAVRQLPLLLVAAARPVPRGPGLLALRRQMREPQSIVLRLEPLTDAQSEELAALLLGDDPREALRRELHRAGGNPLYVTELVNALAVDRRAGSEDVPSSLIAAVTSRFSFLTDATTDILRSASLLGGEFSVSDLAVITGQPARHLVSSVEEAITSGVLVEAGTRLKFRHPLIWDALYHRVAASLRDALHRQAAHALADAGVSVEQVAHQLLLAGEQSDAWSLEWIAAHARELANRTPSLARDLLDSAAARMSASDPRRDTLDPERAGIAFLLGDYEAVLDISGPLLRRSIDPDKRAGSVWLVAYALMRLGRFDESTTVIEETLARHRLGDEWTARLKALLAISFINVSRWDDAIGIADSSPATASLDRAAAGYALHARSLIDYWIGRDRTQMIETIDQALDLIGNDPATSDLCLLLLTNRSNPLMDLDRIEEALRVLHEARVVAERSGTARLDNITLHIADCLFQLGKWDDAQAELETIAGRYNSVLDPLEMCGLLALIAARRDQVGVARRLLGPFADIDLHASTRGFVRRIVMAQCTLAERGGDPSTALSWLLPALDPHVREGLENPYVMLPDLVRLAQATGDFESVTAGVAVAVDEAARGATEYAKAIATQCQALADGDPTLLLATIDGYFRGAPRPYDLARALEDAATLHAASGALDTARGCLNEAVEIYTEMNAAWDIRRADARLRALGIRRGSRTPRRRPKAGLDSLTPTERTVADLVAQGRSNPEIAAELFLSRSTVQTHVSHILGKLGLHSRGQVPAALQELAIGALPQPAP
jgi:DNA-binding CsgD family transcriptional regulator